MVGGTGGGNRYTVAFSLQFHIANLIKLIIHLIGDFFPPRCGTDQLSYHGLDTVLVLLEHLRSSHGSHCTLVADGQHGSQDSLPVAHQVARAGLPAPAP